MCVFEIQTPYYEIIKTYVRQDFSSHLTIILIDQADNCEYIQESSPV